MSWEQTYANGPLMAETTGGLPAPEPYIGDEVLYDLEKLIPISLIREHTKTDDVPAVSDDQLRLYRSASVEAAEQYTGLLLSSSKPITEAVECPWNRNILRKM